MTQDFQEQFLDELLLKAGFEKDDDLELLKEDLRPILQERINLYIFQELNETQREKISQLLKENNIKEADKYTRSCIPDYDDFLMEIYAQFEDEYLENMNKNE